MFGRWGAFVYRRRRFVLLFMLVVAGAAAPLAAGTAGQLSSGGWLDKDLESARVSQRLEAEFGGGESAFIAVFRADAGGGDARSADFQAAIATTLAGLEGDLRVSAITGYAQTFDDRFLSIAGDKTYVVIGLNMTDDKSVEAVDDIEALLAPPAGYSVALTGFGPVQRDSAELSERDLVRAETVSLPIAALVLILVFASIVAAGMPLVVAALAIPTSLAIISLLARETEMSIYVLNIATMLGLALAIDYSLFITSRFREELGRGRATEQAVRIAVATAGKAVVFSWHRRGHRPVGPPVVQGDGPEFDRARRGSRRPELGRLLHDLPAGGPRRPRAARERIVNATAAASAWARRRQRSAS